MSTIVKSFGKKITKQIEEIGLTWFIPWHKMKEVISAAGHQAPGETVEGIVVDDTGITVKFSRSSNKSEQAKAV